MTTRQLEALGIDFNVEEIDPYVGRMPPVPAGSYAAEIIDMKPGGNEGDWWINPVYSIIEGEFKGRKIFDFWGLGKDPDSANYEISWKKVSAVGHAIGILSGGDLTELAFKPMIIEVDFEDEREVVNENDGSTKKYAARNNIVSHAAYAPTKQASGTPVKKVGAPAGSNGVSKPAPKPAAKPQPEQEAEDPDAEGQGTQAQEQEPQAAAGAVKKGVPPWQKKKQ